MTSQTISCWPGYQPGGFGGFGFVGSVGNRILTYDVPVMEPVLFFTMHISSPTCAELARAWRYWLRRGVVQVGSRVADDRLPRCGLNARLGIEGVAEVQAVIDDPEQDQDEDRQHQRELDRRSTGVAASSAGRRRAHGKTIAAHQVAA